MGKLHGTNYGKKRKIMKEIERLGNDKDKFNAERTRILKSHKETGKEVCLFLNKITV